MNMQNTKKLASTLLVCTLMLGGTINASAAEPKEADNTATTATLRLVSLSDVNAGGPQHSIEAARLVPAKTIQMEKIIME